MADWLSALKLLAHQLMILARGQQRERRRIEEELRVKREAEEATAKAERDRIAAEQKAEALHRTIQYFDR